MSNLADKNILFVLGSARSGTTYLNNFLERWFDYGMGPEGTFVARFHKRLGRYGDLSDKKNLARLVDDISTCQMLEIMRKKYRESKRLDVTQEDIHARLLEPSYAGVVYAVFQCLADLAGKSRVGNKNPGYWSQLTLLDELFPEQAKYIAIFRDGRDVFLSLQGTRWGGHSAYVAAKLWRDMTIAIEDFQFRHGSQRLLLLSYEDLLRSPAEAIARIEDYLAVSLAPDVRAIALAEAHSNPMRNNSHKWPSRMSENDRRIYEAVAGDALTKYGYETLSYRPQISILEKRYYDMVELKRLLKVNLYHLRHKFPGDTKKRAREKAARP